MESVFSLIITATGWGVHLKYTGAFNGEGFFGGFGIWAQRILAVVLQSCAGNLARKPFGKAAYTGISGVDVRKCSTAVRDDD